ncbi:hypothetical protein LB504_002803 [Fusarium proliferatum]|nr:hypothetical protein LB504_002803 [Fusarium proliferatum]
MNAHDAKRDAATQPFESPSRPDRDIIEEKRANDICVSTKTESDSVVNGVKVRNRGRARPKLQVREPGTDVETTLEHLTMFAYVSVV